MPPKRSAWVGLAWAASLLGTLALVWFSGFMYWHLRITRLRSDLEFKTGPGYKPRLIAAGSRAVPYLLPQFENAVSRNDREAAIVYFWELSYAIDFADDNVGVGNADTVRADATMESLHDLPAEARLWQNLNRENYPPWWMWWTGKRFTSR